MGEKRHEMPSFEELWEGSKRLRDDPDLEAIRSWTLPNSAKETDEHAVYDRAMEDDDKSFFLQAVCIVKKMKANSAKQQ